MKVKAPHEHCRNEMQRLSEHHDLRQNPDDVRFTKATINLTFPGQLEYENIYDVLSALENRKLLPRDLPSLRVFGHAGQVWTLDNKLLYIYRISPKVKRVPVVYVSGQKFLAKFLDDYSKLDLESMTSADFFPEVINDDARLPTVVGYKDREKDKMIESRSLTPVSSSMRSVSSSRTVASRISSEENMRTEVSSHLVRSKSVHRGRKMSNRPASSTNSSRVSSDDTVEVRKSHTPIRSITGKLLSERFLQGSGRILLDNKECPLSFKFSVRPSTCQETSGASSRFSRKGFFSATRTRLEKASEMLRRLEAYSPKSSKSDHTITSGKNFESPFSASNYSQFAERPSAQAEPEMVLEAFVLPEFCYAKPKYSDVILEDIEGDHAEETPEASALPHFGGPETKATGNLVDNPFEGFSCPQKQNTTQISSEEALDRSVSSCSSSTERPKHRPAPANCGLDRFGRLSVSAGRPMKCQLSADHEFEVSKKILLRHMKKAFFSVY